MSITFGSLFAGIGGFDLGFERAGMTCKWQVEIDPAAVAISKQHWPRVGRHDDIRTFDNQYNRDARCDVLCGGFPCQDISCAGKCAGIRGERSGLFYEALRVVCELRPRIVVLENVSALLIRGLDAVLGELSEIGYDAEWHCLPVAAFGGYTIRDRVFILAYPNGDRWAPILTSDGLLEEGRRETAGPWCGCQPQLERDAGGKVWAMPHADILGVAARFSKGLDEARLKACGNAVSPVVAEYVGRHVHRALTPPRGEVLA